MLKLSLRRLKPGSWFCDPRFTCGCSPAGYWLCADEWDCGSGADRVGLRLNFPTGRYFAVIEFNEWARHGMERGWCGPPVCATHDGVPMSNAEYEDAYEFDSCIHVIRLYQSAETKAEVEQDHSPSRWRKWEVGAE